MQPSACPASMGFPLAALCFSPLCSQPCSRVPGARTSLQTLSGTGPWLRPSEELSFALERSPSLSFNLAVMFTMTRSLETELMLQSSSSQAVCNHADDACKTRDLIVFCRYPGGCQPAEFKARLDGGGKCTSITHPG